MTRPLNDPPRGGEGRKRWRTPVAKPGQLVARYGRVDGDLDLAYAWGGKGASKPDARVLMRALEDVPVLDGKSLREVLTERGYDIETLRFSINQKVPDPHPPV